MLQKQPMKEMRKRLIRPVLLLISFWVIAILSHAQQPKLVFPSSVELQNIKSRLDPKLLPDSAKNLEVESKQVFNLVNANEVQLTLIPVRFEIGIPNPLGEATISNCGLYLIPANGAGNFIWTVGKDKEIAGLVQCTGVQAVGLQSVTDSNPALIFIYHAFTAHESFSEPYVFSWDKNSKAYQIDDDWNRRIDEQQIKVLTIKSIKQLMSQTK